MILQVVVEENLTEVNLKTNKKTIAKYSLISLPFMLKFITLPIKLSYPQSPLFDIV